MLNMNNLRVGLIGVGNMSVMHYNSYKKLPGVEVTAICSRSENTLRKRTDEWGVKKCFLRYEDMLKDEEIDAVNIVTPNSLHAPIAIAALKAGKHVLCEKPPALNAEDAQKMANCARENKKVLMYGFMFRFAERTQMIREFYKKGMFGDIYYAKTGVLRRCGNPGGWFANKEMSGGGPLIDVGVHVIDLALYLMNDPIPVSVFGRTFNTIGKRDNIKDKVWYTAINADEYTNDVEDMTTAMINFKNGSCLHVEVSCSSHIKEDVTYLELLGDKGGVTVEPSLEIHTEMNDYLTDIRPRIDDEMFNYEKSVNNEISHFVDCIRKNTECISTPENGVKIMKIVDAIYKSASIGELVKING